MMRALARHDNVVMEVVAMCFAKFCFTPSPFGGLSLVSMSSTRLQDIVKLPSVLSMDGKT